MSKADHPEHTVEITIDGRLFSGPTGPQPDRCSILRARGSTRPGMTSRSSPGGTAASCSRTRTQVEGPRRRRSSSRSVRQRSRLMCRAAPPGVDGFMAGLGACGVTLSRGRRGRFPSNRCDARAPAVVVSRRRDRRAGRRGRRSPRTGCTSGGVAVRRARTPSGIGDRRLDGHWRDSRTGKRRRPAQAYLAHCPSRSGPRK